MFVATAAAQKQYVGDATYYGNKMHGRRTSSGVRYHKDSLTCAHRTLPFGTLLKVRNPKNGREVVVEVTDRGPFRKGAIVDLSMAAAKEIDMVQCGVARVEVTQLPGEGSMLAKPKEESLLPELELFDPKTGEYYTMSEWAEREQAEREKAKAQAAQQQRAHYLAKNKQQKPEWRVLDSKLTAKSK